MREYDPSMLTANPASTQRESDSQQDTQPEASSSSHPPDHLPTDESAADTSADPFASYFSGDVDPTIPPKVLITTSQKATRVTYEFCEELVSVFPGAELIRRKKGKGFEMGRIAGWAAGREYTHLMVVNEDMKKPSACLWFVVSRSGTYDFSTFSRRYHDSLPPLRTHRLLQTNIHRANTKNFCTSSLLMVDSLAPHSPTVRTHFLLSWNRATPVLQPTSPNSS